MEIKKPGTDYSEEVRENEAFSIQEPAPRVDSNLQMTLRFEVAPEPSYSGYPIDEHFDAAFANGLAELESFNKHLYRPNTYLHKWWARRCGSTFRALLKHLVQNPEKVDYYAPGGLEGKIVLDPMMGGGTTLHEAIRLGANVIGADIDPIPIVQVRAALSEIELEELDSRFAAFFQSVRRDIRSLFLTNCKVCGQDVEVLYWLCGVRKFCDCGEAVQIDQYELRQEKSRSLEICPKCWQVAQGKCACSGLETRPRLITKKDTKCDHCRKVYKELLDVPFYQRYVPVAVYAYCPEHGALLQSINEADIAKVNEANAARARLDFGDAGDFRVEKGPKSRDLLTHGVSSYLELFSSRQLLYIHEGIKALYAESGVAKLSLALLLSTSLEFNSMLCGYKGAGANRPGAIRHVFALHAYSFPYTATENNPVNSRKSSGNLQQLFHDRIERGRSWASAPIERRLGIGSALVRIEGERDSGTEVHSLGELSQGHQRFMLAQGDSRSLPLAEESVDFVVTDPPYYDNVQYSDLARFFRVWLARMLPEEADWTYDHELSAVATSASSDDTGFIEVLGGIFQECGRVLKHEQGRMVFTFHHWDPNAWAELTIALKRANFHLINFYVVLSENPISVHISNLNAIRHDAILVLGRNHESARSWICPAAINTGDSELFCRDCAQTLGSLIVSEQTASEIRETWRSLMGRTNGKIEQAHAKS